MLVVATYLLLVGLHRPGGGFAAGLVAGLALVLRRVAAGPHELGEAALAVEDPDYPFSWAGRRL